MEHAWNIEYRSEIMLLLPCQHIKKKKKKTLLLLNLLSLPDDIGNLRFLLIGSLELLYSTMSVCLSICLLPIEHKPQITLGCI